MNFNVNLIYCKKPEINSNTVSSQNTQVSQNTAFSNAQNVNFVSCTPSVFQHNANKFTVKTNQVKINTD